jgi:site-specific recombinase XerD
VNELGQVQLRRMSVDGVNRIFGKGAKEVVVDSFSPHGLRGAFCSDFLGVNIDIVTVQKLAGRASTTTTAKYDRGNEEVKRAAVQKLEF